MEPKVLVVLFAVIFLTTTNIKGETPETINIATIIPVYYVQDIYYYYSAIYAMKLALEDINSDPNILPNTTFTATNYNSNAVPSKSLEKAMIAIDEGHQVILCCDTSDEAKLVAVASTVFGIPMVSYAGTAGSLLDRATYPDLSIIVPVDIHEAEAMADIIHYMGKQRGQSQYYEIGIICTTDDYGVTTSSHLITIAPNYGITIKTYQQFLREEQNINTELTQLQKSGARVFVMITDDVDGYNVMRKIHEYGIVGENYIWICSAGCATYFVYVNSDYQIDEVAKANAMGMIGVNVPTGYDDEIYRQLVNGWQSLNPEYYAYGGPNTLPDIYTQKTYDGFYFLAYVFDHLVRENEITQDGKIKNVTTFLEAMNEVTYSGCTGPIQLDSNRNRLPLFDILNQQPNNDDLTQIGMWRYDNGVQLSSSIVFYDESTNYPDLDVRKPYHYWSCSDRDEKYDATGKSAHLTYPDSSNPNLKLDYHCDHFIDCENISDESVDCSSNFTTLYIVYAVITFVLILIALLFVCFTIVFGFCWRRTQIRASSPTFLIIICLSCIVGYGSTFAWYGKPNAVACGFQMWLLGLSVVSLVSALCSKTFRIWRIFYFPSANAARVITDYELVIMWILFILPVVLILFLWTLISTPTTVLLEIDGKDHLVCDTGGFTGPPGGYIFFGILVFYEGLILVLAALLSIGTRKVPTLFNESKLIGISIYNLFFLSIIIIPVVLVLNERNQFVSWIVRTTGILYAFTATLWLQFLPKIVGIIVTSLRRRKNNNSSSSLHDFSEAINRANEYPSTTETASTL